MIDWAWVVERLLSLFGFAACVFFTLIALKSLKASGMLAGLRAETTIRKKPYRYHEEATTKSFQNDPRFATEYLNAVLENGDKQELMTALRYLAKAFGGGK